MRTVGEILKKARLEKKLSLEEVERVIKIRAKYLKAIEESDYQSLPASAYVKGFIKNYGEFLDLSVDRLLAIFRREFDERKTSVLLPRGLSTPLNKSFFKINPPIMMGFFFLFFLFLFFVYLFIQYRSFLGTPSLTLQKPEENALIKGSTVEVIGRTDPEIRLTINNQPISLDQEGNFQENIMVEEGVNTLVFTATNKFNKTKIVKRTIRVENP